VPSLRVSVRHVEVFLRELGAADQFSGVVGVTQGDQRLLLEALGYASRTWNIPATVETRFDTASITKLFTAVATLQLVERGAFALNTPVIGYLGLEDSGISPAVTPYHLLTHTSGIGDDADEEAGERYEDVFLKRPTYSVIETADYLPQFLGKPANFAPGDGCRYCNVGYVLLGLSARGAVRHMMGFGFGFETDGVVRRYWKEGVNVGVSANLCHYPAQDITFAVLAVGENAASIPVKAIEKAVANV
jgi:hypothetical protein